MMTPKYGTDTTKIIKLFHKLWSVLYTEVSKKLKIINNSCFTDHGSDADIVYKLLFLNEIDIYEHQQSTMNINSMTGLTYHKLGILYTNIIVIN